MGFVDSLRSTAALIAKANPNHRPAGDSRGGEFAPKAGGAAGAEFKAWFGDSKAVDANGRPLRVYHGTVEDFSSFDAKHGSKNTTAESGKGGFFFTTNPDVAESYAEGTRTATASLMDRARMAVGGRREQRGANIMPVYLSMKNPLLTDFRGLGAVDAVFAEVIRQAKAEGHDGVVFRNVTDPGSRSAVAKLSTVYVVFSPTQVKSAIGNSGSYSREVADITKANDRHEPKGAPGGKGGQFARKEGVADDTYYQDMHDWLEGGGDYEPKVKPRPATWQPHPKRDDKGGEVGIDYPSKASSADTWGNPDATATFVPGGAVPPSINDVEFKSWNAPTTVEDWASVEGQNADMLDPPLVAKHEKDHVSTGVMIVESDGRVWLTEPTNHFGGYNATWPKGTLEAGLGPQANAIKEAWEETGLKVRIIGSLGDHQRDTSIARMYVAIRTGGTPRDMGWESQAMKLAPIGDVPTILNRTHDRALAKSLHDLMRGAKIVKAAGRKPSLKHLYLAATNVNAPSVNKKLDLITKYGEAGDINGLLSVNFGVNNYAKAAVKATNQWLGYHGSTHKVVPGQKANSHPALAAGSVPNAVTSMSAGTSVDAPAAGGGDFESKHPRYPKGHPLGGQFMKKDAAGLTLPPEVEGFTGANKALYGMAQKGNKESLDFLKATVSGEAGADVKAYAQQLLDDIAENGKAPVPAFTPPPNDYHWFGVAHQAALTGDMATLDELGDKYKSKSLQATLDGYVDKLQSEMAVHAEGGKFPQGVTADVPKAPKIVTASIMGVDVPDTVPGSNPSNAIGVMSKAAITADKATLNSAVMNAEDMAAGDGHDKADWTKAADYGAKLQKKFDDTTVANAVAERIQGPPSIKSWKEVGAKPGGSNPGGLYVDAKGDKWLVKGNAHQASTGNAVSDDRARNEVLASKLMAAAGIPAPDIKLVRLGGKFGGTGSGEGDLGVAVKWIDDVKPWMNTNSTRAAAQEQFGVHAWIGNYDVMGMNNDNMMISPTKGVINVDPGGAILFRAQGLKKEIFSHAASEWDSMRDPKYPSSHKVFGPMTSEQLVTAANKVGAIKPEIIDELVKTYGPGNEAARNVLAAKMKERRADIMDRAAVVSKGSVWSNGDGTKVIKDAEFEAKHARNIDGTFKKKDEFGLSYQPPNTPYAGMLHAQAKLALAGDAKMLAEVKAVTGHANPATAAYATQLVSDIKSAQGSAKLDAMTGDGKSFTRPDFSASYDQTDGMKAYQAAKEGDTSTVNGYAKFGTAPVQAYAKTLQAEMGLTGDAAQAIKTQATISDAVPFPPILSASYPMTKVQLADMHAAAKVGDWSKVDDIAEKNASKSAIAGYHKELKNFQIAGGLKQAASPAVLNLNDPDITSKLQAALDTKKPAAGPLPGMPDFDSYKLALANVNAASVNNKLDKLKSLATAGDEKGILALGYGTNNYAKKHHVAVANQALAAMGSKYQVAAGQKAGTHLAVNLSGAAAATSSAPKSAAPGVVAKKVIVVPDSALPKAPQFMNWEGSGKSGPSSQPHVNEANAAAVSYLQGLAKQGDFDAFKAATFPEIFKEGPDAGKTTGKQLPFYEHPSKYVKGYFGDVIDAIDEIANPPVPLKLGKNFKATTLAALAREASPTPLLAPMKSVPSANRFGFWVALGNSSLSGEEPPINALGSSQVSAGKKAYQSYSPTTKTFVSLVQSGGVLGAYKSDASSYSGHNLKALASSAANDATPLPKGSTLFRWQNMPKGMIDQLKLLTPGSVIQGTAPMPTSYDPTATKGFGQHLIRFHAGPGAVAIHSHGSGGFSGEKEITILPSQRFVLMAKKNTGLRWEVDMMLLPPTIK